jgi:hypothetical protein
VAAVPGHCSRIQGRVDVIVRVFMVGSFLLFVRVLLPAFRQCVVNHTMRR